MKTTIRLDCAQQFRVELDIEIRDVQDVSPHLTIDLLPTPNGAQELSISAMIWQGRREDSAGQCIDTVLQLTAEHPKAAAVAKLCEIWRRWHLGGLNAGTRAQREALADMAPAVYPESHYDKALAHLESKGVLRDPASSGKWPGYKYGSAWLCEPLPAEVAAQVDALIAELAA